MIQDTETLKSEILTGLDTLSPGELQQVHEFITFLRWQNHPHEATPDNLLQGGPPLVEEEIPAANRVGWKEWDQRFDQ
jgi:hypothetical protein